MTAETVLKTMLLKYSALRSYQDRGIVLTTWPDKAEPDEITFMTFFCRPDRFRFDWTSHHPYPPLRHLKTRHVIWSDGTGTFRYTDRDRGEISTEESPAMAIAGATGVSKGSALRVFNMLMPEIIGARTFAELQGTDLRRDLFEGIDCHRINGTDFLGDEQEICISVRDSTLQSVSSSLGDNVLSLEIRREIHIDEPIDSSIFDFNPSN